MYLKVLENGDCGEQAAYGEGIRSNVSKEELFQLWDWNSITGEAHGCHSIFVWFFRINYLKECLQMMLIWSHIQAWAIGRKLPWGVMWKILRRLDWQSCSSDVVDSHIEVIRNNWLVIGDRFKVVFFSVDIIQWSHRHKWMPGNFSPRFRYFTEILDVLVFQWNATDTFSSFWGAGTL